MKVSLWVPYWVVNATSLPLTLEHYHPAGSTQDSGFLLGDEGTRTTAEAHLQLPPSHATTAEQASFVGASSSTKNKTLPMNAGSSGSRQREGERRFTRAEKGKSSSLNENIVQSGGGSDGVGNGLGLGPAAEIKVPAERGTLLSPRRESNFFAQPPLLRLKILVGDGRNDDDGQDNQTDEENFDGEKGSTLLNREGGEDRAEKQKERGGRRLLVAGEEGTRSVSRCVVCWCRSVHVC